MYTIIGKQQLENAIASSREIVATSEPESAAYIQASSDIEFLESQLREFQKELDQAG